MEEFDNPNDPKSRNKDRRLWMINIMLFVLSITCICINICVLITYDFDTQVAIPMIILCMTIYSFFIVMYTGNRIKMTDRTQNKFIDCLFTWSACDICVEPIIKFYAQLVPLFMVIIVILTFVMIFNFVVDYES